MESTGGRGRTSTSTNGWVLLENVRPNTCNSVKYSHTLSARDYLLLAVLFNLWGLVLGSFFGRKVLTLIDGAPSYLHSCRKLPRLNNGGWENEPAVLPNTMGALRQIVNGQFGKQTCWFLFPDFKLRKFFVWFLAVL